MKKTRDMTQGKPLGLLLSFAVPLMLGSLCQLLYTTADSAVVGRLIGVDAFAAVGAAGFLSWLLYSVAGGLTQGFGVVFAQLFGKKDWRRLRKAVAMALYIVAGLGTIFTVAGIFCVDPILRLMGTPKEIRAETCVYLYWIFGGSLLTLANRMAGSLLLALGVSQVSVAANVASCVLNILLDLLFVGVFQWGVAGVAAATVAAQLGSALWCLGRLWAIRELRLSGKDFAPSSALLRELGRLGGSFAFRDGVIAVGGLFVQSAINGYGKLFVSGMAAAEKFFGLITLTGSAFEGAFATFCAQNFGAGYMGRIKEGLRYSAGAAVASAILMVGVVLLFGRDLIGLLVAGNPDDLREIAQVGHEDMVVQAITVPIMYLLCLYRSGLQSIGSSLAPTLSGFVELGLRILAVLLLPGVLGRWAVYLANPIGWLGALLLLGTAYYRTYYRYAQMDI